MFLYFSLLFFYWCYFLVVVGDRKVHTKCSFHCYCLFIIHKAMNKSFEGPNTQHLIQDLWNVNSIQPFQLPKSLEQSTRQQLSLIVLTAKINSLSMESIVSHLVCSWIILCHLKSQIKSPRLYPTFLNWKET